MLIIQGVHVPAWIALIIIIVLWGTWFFIAFHVKDRLLNALDDRHEKRKGVGLYGRRTRR